MKLTIRQQLKNVWSDIKAMRSGQPANRYELGRYSELFGHISGHIRSMFSHHESANTGRLYSDWTTSYDTPYRDYNGAREKIIARSIKAADNNPVAKTIIDTIVSDVVGTGIKPVPRIKTKSGTLVKGLNDQLAEGWKRYNDQWDSTGYGTFYECQQLLLRETIMSGAVLTNKVKSGDNYLGVGTQIVPALRLDTSKDLGNPTLSDNPLVKQTAYGINLDEYGKPVSYYFKGVDNPVPAKFVNHIFKRMKAEEYTGTPWLSVALRWLWATEQLVQDKLIASRIQAMIGILVPTSTYNDLVNNDLNSDSQIDLSAGKIWRYDPTRNAKPEIMQADDSIKEMLIPLKRMILHTVTASQGYSYQTITRDVSEINQAAGRINTNRDEETSRSIQRWFAKKACQYEWDWFVYSMFVSGKIAGYNATDYFKDPWKYNQCQWQTPGREFIDPARESQAIERLVNNKLMSRQRWYSEHYGEDWRDVVDQIAEEEDYMRSIGVVSEAMAKEEGVVYEEENEDSEF